MDENQPPTLLSLPEALIDPIKACERAQARIRRDRLPAASPAHGSGPTRLDIETLAVDWASPRGAVAVNALLGALLGGCAALATHPVDPWMVVFVGGAAALAATLATASSQRSSCALADGKEPNTAFRFSSWPLLALAVVLASSPGPVLGTILRGGVVLLAGAGPWIAGLHRLRSMREARTAIREAEARQTLAKTEAAVAARDAPEPENQRSVWPAAWPKLPS